MLESPLPHGAFTTVIAPRRTISSLTVRDASIVIEHADGSVHEHAGGENSWRIALRTGAATSSIELAGAVPQLRAPSADTPLVDRVDIRQPPLAIDAQHALSFSLGERDYRRSEQSWSEAGSPAATVTLSTAGDELAVAIAADHGPVVIIADDAINEMDNESPDVNATGVQLSIGVANGAVHRWLIRPGGDGSARVRVLTRGPIPLRAATTVRASGWEARVAIPLGALGDASPYSITLGVTINETVPGRERRRGQLVLGGAEGECVYLRGDRHDPSQLIPIVIHR